MPHATPALLAIDGALVGLATVLGVAQAASERSVMISILAGLGGTGVILIAIGIWAVKSHLAFRDQMIREQEQDRSTFDKKLADLQRLNDERLERVRQGVEQSLNSKHSENQAVLAAMSASLGEVRTLLLGTAGQGGLLESERKRRQRSHDLSSDVQALIYRMQLLEQWAERACEAGSLPAFDAVQHTGRRSTDLRE